MSGACWIVEQAATWGRPSGVGPDVLVRVFQVHGYDVCGRLLLRVHRLM
jgi:hypothetical protein